MKAKPGDHIILAAPTVDGALREGEIVEVRGKDGGPPYAVRWSDGHEGLLYPGPGSVLRVSPGHADVAPVHPEAAAGTLAEPAGAATPTSGRQHVKDWQVRISVFGSDDDAEATVVLLADSPKHLQARGQSHRSDHDRTVPEIGEEVAVARALRRLADQLLDTAADDIEQVTGEHDVRLRAR
jgi:hypothetical protein